MGILLQLRGFQLIMTFLPIYSDGGFSQDVFRVGPFRNRQSLKEWQASFVDCFQAEFEKEEEITECRISSSYIESYDPRQPAFYPLYPLLIAREVLDIMLESVFREYQDDSVGPFLWKALIRLEMKAGNFPLDTQVVCGPFSDREDIPSWCTPFIQSVRQRASQVRGVKLELLEESIVAESRYSFNEDEEYLLNANLDPTAAGQKFFSEVMQDLIAACNIKS
jgi:hypothetical protein